MKIKMKSKKMMGVVASALLLLALSAPPAAYGQSDGFFNNAGGVRDNGNGNTNGPGANSWMNFGDNTGGEGTWKGFEDGDAPLGGGLLVLALSGVCYAGAKRVKRLKV